MKISREKRDSIIEHNAYGARVTTIVDNVLAELGITVEPPPIVPGVSGGEWTFDSGYGGCIMDALMDGRIIHKCLGAADGKVMAGSKKLAELVVAMLRQNRAHRTGPVKKWVNYTPLFIAQLEKMGVDVDEFEGLV